VADASGAGADVCNVRTADTGRVGSMSSGGVSPPVSADVDRAATRLDFCESAVVTLIELYPRRNDSVIRK